MEYNTKFRIIKRDIRLSNIDLIKKYKERTYHSLFTSALADGNINENTSLRFSYRELPLEEQMEDPINYNLTPDDDDWCYTFKSTLMISHV